VGHHDVALAIQARAEKYFVPPPPQDLLLELAATRNQAPFPELRTRFGLRIPPEGECLLAPNYQLAPASHEPPVRGAAIDPSAVQARAKSSEDALRKHVMTIVAPGGGEWRPGPDPPADEDWPEEI
jgi:transcription initiation factor TFIID subunit 9B